MTTGTRLLLAAAGAALLTACSSDPASTAPTGQPPAPAPSSTPRASTSASPSGEVNLSTPKTVAGGLEVPWGLAFLPDGSALVSERDKGRILRIPAGGGNPEPVYTVPGVDAGGEGGLLGLAVDPDYATNKFVYAYFTAADDNR